MKFQNSREISRYFVVGAPPLTPFKIPGSAPDTTFFDLMVRRSTGMERACAVQCGVILSSTRPIARIA